MKGTAFMEAFVGSIEIETPSGYGSEWTDGMYRVLERVGRHAGYVVNSKQSHGEINHIDFSFFPRSRGANWHSPAVVVEHENAWSIEETKKDFWKCCLYAAPLRVTIGYMSTEERAVEAGRSLTHFFDRWELPRFRGGEVLLIYGWPPRDETLREWRYWLLRGESGGWIEGCAQQSAETDMTSRVTRLED